MPEALFTTWFLEDGAYGIGEQTLVSRGLTAFFASRKCPGSAIRTTMDWAVEQTRKKTPLIGGFQSPLERSVLEIVLAAKSPVVIVLARALDNARLPLPWHTALNDGRAVVVSMAPASQRLSEAVATKRNHWIASHASSIVLGHVASSGLLAGLVEQWRRDGRTVEVLTPCRS
jgi:hypothetical protein